VAPKDGAVNPIQLVEAFRADAVRRGVELVEDQVISLSRSNGRVSGVQGRAWHPADHVVLAAGAWTGRIANLPRPVSVEPVRGQMVALPWVEGAAPSIVFGGGGYAMHRDREAWCGSTMEHAGFVPAVTESALAELRARADSLLPSLAGARVLRAWAGLRPGTPDGLPIVGKEPDLEGLWYATGHGRNGVLLAGITAMIIDQLLSGEATLEEAYVLRPERFWSW
jgi:glycine oxidase